MAQDWLHFFCLILMTKWPKNNKKGQKKQQQLLTLSCILVDSQIKTKKHNQNILAPDLLSCSYLFIFSQFFLPTYPPTRPPAHKCSTRPAQMRAKKQLTLISSFLIQKNSFAPKILIKTKNSKQDIFKFEAPNLTLYKNTKKSF